MTLDISKFHRRTPIAPAHKHRYVTQFRPGEFWLNHCVPFGSSPAESNSSETGNFTLAVWKCLGIGPVVKWSDDHNIFRFPIAGDGITTPFSYAYDSQKVLEAVASIGVPWHPFSSKGQDFSSITTYTGFCWDIRSRQVYLPERKRKKFSRRVEEFKAKCTSTGVTVEEAMKIQGTLVHIIFVCPQGRSYLPRLSRFIANCNATNSNEFVQKHPERAVITELNFWMSFLSQPASPRTLKQRGPPIDLNISVDASTSWGIGVTMGICWAGWEINPGFANGPFGKIGLLEALAVELIVYILEALGYRDCCITVLSDNKGVIGAYLRGRSRNVLVNLSIRRVTAILWERNISLNLIYIRSAENPADPISQGILGQPDRRISAPFRLPEELEPLLSYA